MLLISPFHNRARLWIEERSKYPLDFSRLTPGKKRIWFHCASLGEFDQALPVIKRLEKKEDHQILVSFYSPSGFQQIRKKKEFEHYFTFYLPEDYPSKMSALVQIIEPKALFIVKYEFWYHLIKEVNKKSIPIYLVSAYFHQDQSYFKAFFRSFYLDLFNCFKTIFLLNEESKHLLIEKGVLSDLQVTGDTRVEQCLENTKINFEDDIIETFSGSHRVIVLGSSWPAEEELLSKVIPKLTRYRFIIAPHDISAPHLKKIEDLFPNNSVRYSNFREYTDNVQILIIDNVGMLKNLYSYAWLSFIGGGFSGRLHNVLESIAYGVPVICGSKTKRYPEAEILEGLHSLIRIERNEEELIDAIAFFDNEKNYVGSKEKAKNYILQNSHAAEMLLTGLNL